MNYENEIKVFGITEIATTNDFFDFNFVNDVSSRIEFSTGEMFGDVCQVAKYWDEEFEVAFYQGEYSCADWFGITDFHLACCTYVLL